MPRGGRRPGAGAPKGNLNALKHGRTSVAYNLMVAALVEFPEIREMFIAFHRNQERQKRHARRIARDLFARMLQGMPPQEDPEINQTIQTLLVYSKLAGQLVKNKNQSGFEGEQSIPTSRDQAAEKSQ